jgi:hypothetical protein
MIRKSFTLLALVLAAAAVAAPIAQAATRPDDRSGPLGVGAPTVAASHVAVRPDDRGGPLGVGTDTTIQVDPLAVSYLMGKGLTPSEVKSWTVGACSHQVKAASCYAMLEPVSIAAASTKVARSIGFQWGDAGIGAGATLGIVLLLGGAGAGLLISRQNRRRQIARA